MVKQNWKAARSRIRVQRAHKPRWSAAGQDRWQLAARIAFPASLLVLLLVLFVAIVGWLNPVPAPKLILLTTRTAGETLPPNAAAAADARMLQGLGGVFDVSDAAAPSTGPAMTNREQMLAIIDGMRMHQPRWQLVAPWQPTTTVFYVNAIGVGLPDRTETGELAAERAWLVPDGFDPTEDPRSQLVQLADLVESITASAADRKLVVLDCQRPGVHPYFGASTGRFVAAAIDELEGLPPEQKSGLYVLLSSSPGEVSWHMHPGAGSVFGHFLASGLAGAADDAGDRNERVTLAELRDYLSQQVGRWVADFCVADQHPHLLDFGQNSGEVLLSAGRGEQLPPAALPAGGGFSRSEVTAALERNWMRCFDFTLRSQPPFEWAPVQWNYIQDRLLLAERLFRSSDYANAGLVLADVDTAFESMLETHRALQQLLSVSSPSAARFLSDTCGADWPELPAVTSDGDARLLVEDFVAGTTPLDETVSDLAESADAGEPLPPAAHFLSLAAARQSGTITQQGLRDLSRLRLLAEDVARPRHPLVAGWVWRDLHTADGSRRDAEDRALLGDGQPLPLGQPAPDSGNPHTQFQLVQEQKALLDDAWRLRDRLLSDLPFWIAFIEASQPHIDGFTVADQGDSEDDAPVPPNEAPAADPSSPRSRPGAEFPQQAAALVDSLLDDLTLLTEALLADPDQLDEDQRVRRINVIAGICDRINAADSGGLTQLRTGLLVYADALSQARVWPATGDTWRRIDSLLHLPLPMLEGDGEESAFPRDAARLRMLLVTRTSEQLAPADAPRPSPADQAAAVNEHRLFTSRLYQNLYLLPLPADARPSFAELAPDVFREQLIDLASDDSQLDPVALLRADLAFRLLRRSLGTDLGVMSPVIRLRTGAQVDTLLWQSQRVIDDFYAALPENTDGAPYYDQLASDLLRGAASLERGAEALRSSADSLNGNQAADASPSVPAAATVGDAGDPRIDAMQQRLLDLNELLRSSRLSLQPNSLQFRATLSEELVVNIPRGGDFPTGIAAIKATATEGVTPTTDSGEAVRFQVERPADAAAASIAVSGYYRGHQFEGRAPLEVILGERGRSVTYARQNTGNGRVRLRSRPLVQDPLQLLFVLDCSGSMALPDQSGESRISGLRNVLTEFAERMPPGSVAVGVRLFGHRYRDVAAPEAHTDSELILPIGAFGPARLQEVRTKLRPVGHSPIFNALIQSRDDFPGEAAGRRDIVLISDGADNWALAGQTPGTDELNQAFLGTGIRINAIGYRVEQFGDFRQLQDIAAAGDLNGRCVTVDDAPSLLREIAGLAGLPGFRILRDGRPVHEDYQFTSGDQAVELPPGEYLIEVVGPGRNVLADKSIRLRPGESHDLVYDSASLAYEDSPAESALAFVPGTVDQPDLVILEAQKIDTELLLEFGLLDKPDNPVNLLPISATVTAVTPAGRREWHLNRLPPNVPNRHFPLWRVQLADWPVEVTGARVAVTWNDLPGPGGRSTSAVPLDWGSRFAPGPVADGLLLTSREEQSITLDGVRHPATSLTFVLQEPGPGIERWSVTVDEPTLYAVHGYDEEHGILHVQLVLQDDSRPDRVTLVQSGAPRADRRLEIGVPFGSERINP